MEITANRFYKYIQDSLDNKRVGKVENSIAAPPKELSSDIHTINIYYQSTIAEFKFDKEIDFKIDDIGYIGKYLEELTQDEATALVSDIGFFGIEQTSKRIANFVLNGAGDSEEMLKIGREGVLNGFKQAEEIWGDKLPEISYKTLDFALALIDKKISSLGFGVLDLQG